MKTRTLAAVVGISAAALAVSIFGSSQMRERLRMRQYVRRQRQRQYPGIARHTALDIRPFVDALNDHAQRRATHSAVPHTLKTLVMLQDDLATGRISAEELVLDCLARIRDAAHLNAVLELNPDLLTQARTRDAERRAGLLHGPLHGIPIILKDNIATGDHMHTTAGALALDQAGSDRDSFVAHRLRAAGAILLGKANMSEWAFYMSSDGVNGFSTLGGQTHHPLGIFDVGGSSSGSAAAVSAGLVPAAIGTETAGSLVYPASQHGLVTIKPSLGLISRDHIIPITDALDTAGPITHTVTDTALLMSILTGHDSNDPLTEHARTLAGTHWLDMLQPDVLRGVRVGVVWNTPRDDDPSMVQRGIAILKRAGAEVIDVPNPQRVEYRELMQRGFKNALNSYLASVSGYTPVRSLAEIIAFNLENPVGRAPYGQDLLERAETDTTSIAEHAERTLEIRRNAAEQLQAHMNEHRIEWLVGLSNYLTSAYAPAGFPAVCVPCGTRANGEPVGITFVGPHLSDARLLAAAYAFEVAHSHFNVTP